MPIHSEDVERYLAFEHGKPPWPAEQSDREYVWECRHRGALDRHYQWHPPRCTADSPHDEGRCQWVLR